MLHVTARSTGALTAPHAPRRCAAQAPADLLCPVPQRQLHTKIFLRVFSDFTVFRARSHTMSSNSHALHRVLWALHSASCLHAQDKVACRASAYLCQHRADLYLYRGGRLWAPRRHRAPILRSVAQPPLVPLPLLMDATDCLWPIIDRRRRKAFPLLSSAARRSGTAPVSRWAPTLAWTASVWTRGASIFGQPTAWRNVNRRWRPADQDHEGLCSSLLLSLVVVTALLLQKCSACWLLAARPLPCFVFDGHMVVAYL